MQTHLVNSQLLSRKDVRVWFFQERDFAGDATAIADNGIMFQVKIDLPRGADPVTFHPGLCAGLRGKTVEAEISSPKIKGQFRLKLQQVDLISAKKGAISFIATFVTSPDPRFMRLLLEPVLTRVPKKAP